MLFRSADHAPLRLEVVRVRLTPEARGEVVGLRIGEDDERGGKVEFGVLEVV